MLLLLLAAAEFPAPAYSPALRTVDLLDQLLLLNELFYGYLHAKYTVRMPSVSYVVLCSAGCFCAHELGVVCPMADDCFVLCVSSVFFIFV